MADGSRALEIEADAAAAEAAREAKAEVLARAVTVESAEHAPQAESAAKGRAKSAMVRVHGQRLDHALQLGRVRHLQAQPQPREVAPVHDRHGYLRRGYPERRAHRAAGYREDLWAQNTGMDKRLVFKLFNETVNWRATMDLMIGRSLQLTLGARGLPVTCFSVNAGDHDNMVYLERSANKWPLMPENFSFFLLEEGKPQFYRLRRDLIDLGGDYTLYNHHNEKSAARRQGVLHRRQVVRPGEVGARRPAPADRAEAVLRHADLQRRGAPPYAHPGPRDRAGKYKPKLEKQEADLYMNPRRVR